MCAMLTPNNTSFKKGNVPWNKGKTLTDSMKKTLSEIRLNSKFRSGRFHPRWKGGVQKHHSGYKKIFVYGENRNRRLEHRHVIENLIGRRLQRNEVVHHLGDKSDNRPEMLMVFKNHSAHMRFHFDAKNAKTEEIIFDGRAYNAGIGNVVKGRMPKITRDYLVKYRGAK